MMDQDIADDTEQFNTTTFGQELCKNVLEAIMV